MIGVDEVGRGAWAGPLLVCAVDLIYPVAGLTDSKKLTKKRREQLAEQIVLAGNPVGFGWVSADELDDIGLSASLSLGAAKALSELDMNQPITVDGNVQFYPLLTNSQTLIKADLKEPAASAASIVAKVARDNRMAQYAINYPSYGFEAHVGYGTRAHKLAIEAHGMTRLHRKSFKF